MKPDGKKSFDPKARKGRAQRGRLFALVAPLIFALFASEFCFAARSVEDISDGPVISAVSKHYGSTVEAVKEFRPFYLTGDFNADGTQDLLVVVKLKAERSQLPNDVTITNPFGFRDINSPNQSSSAEGEGVALCFAIIHGGQKGWTGAKPKAKHLLLGGSPLLIMDHQRISSGEVKDLMSVVRASRARRGKYGEYGVAQSARGDWVLVSTQVGEGLIYWDGKTYRFKDSPQD